MKVLWFAVTPSLYSLSNLSHNGGGWISSLESLIRKMPDIELGVAFEHSDSCFRVELEGVTYYPMNVRKSKYNRLKQKFIYTPEEQGLIPMCLKVIDDFKPDVIHVFGSEWCFGLLAQDTNIPVVIHMQGSLPPYYNSLFPPGYSKSDIVMNNGINLKKTVKDLLFIKTFKLQALREEKILRGCQYYMGRTGWDKNLTRFYAPDSKYYYCSEALREPFINTDRIWKQNNRNKMIFVSTISSPIYKGFDVILKTAKLIKENTPLDFEWHVFGTNEVKFHEWETNIKAFEVNVKLMGSVSAERLKDELLNTDIFIHPSYIDNSPNSICEAQVLGLPVISTNVGGISSLIEHMKTGLLVPANDPYTIASYIKLLIENKKLTAQLSTNAREIALKRHNPHQIVIDLVNIYKKVINDEKSV